MCCVVDVIDHRCCLHAGSSWAVCGCSGPETAEYYIHICSGLGWPCCRCSSVRDRDLVSSSSARSHCKLQIVLLLCCGCRLLHRAVMIFMPCLLLFCLLPIAFCGLPLFIRILQRYVSQTTLTRTHTTPTFELEVGFGSALFARCRLQGPVPGRGATTAQLGELPSTTFQEGADEDPAQRTCAVCLSDYENGDEVRVLPCSGAHRFHKRYVGDRSVQCAGWAHRRRLESPRAATMALRWALDMTRCWWSLLVLSSVRFDHVTGRCCHCRLLSLIICCCIGVVFAVVMPLSLALSLPMFCCCLCRCCCRRAGVSMSGWSSTRRARSVVTRWWAAPLVLLLERLRPLVVPPRHTLPTAQQVAACWCSICFSFVRVVTCKKEHAEVDDAHHRQGAP